MMQPILASSSSRVSHTGAVSRSVRDDKAVVADDDVASRSAQSLQLMHCAAAVFTCSFRRHPRGHRYTNIIPHQSTTTSSDSMKKVTDHHSLSFVIIRSLMLSFRFLLNK